MDRRFHKTMALAAIVLAAGYLSLAGVGQAMADTAANQIPAWATLRSQVQGEAASASAGNEQRADLFRQAPVLSGRLRVSEQTVMPYIGAGFGGGYVTERDRALNPQPSVPQQSLFGDSMGKSMMPNEFQMGIRIPF